MADDRPDDPAAHAAERAARSSYGRLVALLAAGSGDIAAAEDALSDAFAAALRTWPDTGVPDRPDAWLLTAARRNLLHGHRYAEVRTRRRDDVVAVIDDAAAAVASPIDRRLELLFVCAHPAIDASVRTPLMLQTVLGLDAERIGSAFLVAPSAMAQRLVRAKRKIRDARVPFRVPGPEVFADRLDEVLDAIYAAYGVGWDDHEDGSALIDEALFLGQLLVELLPDEPEPTGLLALMRYSHARRAARRDADGRFVPLRDQDVSRWDRSEIVEAERLLTRASHPGTFGRYACEAAIQSVHVQRGVTGEVAHDALCTLYALLHAHEPSIGVGVARAGALTEAWRLHAAQAVLDGLDARRRDTYQPYWVVCARLAERQGDRERARGHLERALGLTTDAAVRGFL